MNIFVTSHCPIESATWLDDKRLVKMVLESAQMLSTCLNYYNLTSPYKTTHLNHPCNVWVREGRSNYLWLLDHFNALSSEYTLRYNKKHKCDEYYNIFSYGAQFIPEGSSPFVNCSTNKQKEISFAHISDVHDAYRKYLNARWKTDARTPNWKNNNPPQWLEL